MSLLSSFFFKPTYRLLASPSNLPISPLHRLLPTKPPAAPSKIPASTYSLVHSITYFNTKPEIELLYLNSGEILKRIWPEGTRSRIIEMDATHWLLPKIAFTTTSNSIGNNLNRNMNMNMNMNGNEVERNNINEGIERDARIILDNVLKDIGDLGNGLGRPDHLSLKDVLKEGFKGPILGAIEFLDPDDLDEGEVRMEVGKEGRKRLIEVMEIDDDEEEFEGMNQESLREPRLKERENEIKAKELGLTWTQISEKLVEEVKKSNSITSNRNKINLEEALEVGDNEEVKLIREQRVTDENDFWEEFSKEDIFNMNCFELDEEIKKGSTVGKKVIGGGRKVIPKKITAGKKLAASKKKVVVGK